LVFRSGTGAYSTIAAVVADAADGRSVIHRSVVYVMNTSDVHVVHRAVVIKLSALPTAAFIALSIVSISITDPAVEPDRRRPIAIIEDVPTVAPTPIGRCPKQAGFWRLDPCPWHPVVIVVSISPVSGYPEIAVAGRERLLVFRQRWGGV
jgi:hypothetical protein